MHVAVPHHDLLLVIQSLAACLQVLVQLLADLRQLNSVMVLVTSRVALPTADLGAALQLQPLAEGPAAELLASRAGGFSTRLAQPLATRLARQCNGNPLLLTIVGEEIGSRPGLDPEVPILTPSQTDSAAPVICLCVCDVCMASSGDRPLSPPLRVRSTTTLINS